MADWTPEDEQQYQLLKSQIEQLQPKMTPEQKAISGAADYLQKQYGYTPDPNINPEEAHLRDVRNQYVTFLQGKGQRPDMSDPTAQRVHKEWLSGNLNKKYEQYGWDLPKAEVGLEEPLVDPISFVASEATLAGRGAGSAIKAGKTLGDIIKSGLGSTETAQMTKTLPQLIGKTKEFATKPLYKARQLGGQFLADLTPEEAAAVANQNARVQAYKATNELGREKLASEAIRKQQEEVGKIIDYSDEGIDRLIHNKWVDDPSLNVPRESDVYKSVPTLKQTTPEVPRGTQYSFSTPDRMQPPSVGKSTVNEVTFNPSKPNVPQGQMEMFPTEPIAMTTGEGGATQVAPQVISKTREVPTAVSSPQIGPKQTEFIKTTPDINLPPQVDMEQQLIRRGRGSLLSDVRKRAQELSAKKWIEDPLVPGKRTINPEYTAEYAKLRDAIRNSLASPEEKVMLEEFYDAMETGLGGKKALNKGTRTTPEHLLGNKRPTNLLKGTKKAGMQSIDELVGNTALQEESAALHAGEKLSKPLSIKDPITGLSRKIGETILPTTPFQTTPLDVKASDIGQILKYPAIGTLRHREEKYPVTDIKDLIVPKSTSKDSGWSDQDEQEYQMLKSQILQLQGK